jgi:membrane protease subunit (stomatin/prohibitin family)
MPFCTNCGSEIEDHQKFCPNCGVPTEQTPTSSGGDTPPPKKGIIGDVDREDIEKGVEKGVEAAKKGLGAAFRLARRGIKQGTELAGKGIDAAKETIEEQRSPKDEAEPGAQDQRFCPQCAQPVTGTVKFCSHCGHKLE